MAISEGSLRDRGVMKRSVKPVVRGGPSPLPAGMAAVLARFFGL